MPQLEWSDIQHFSPAEFNCRCKVCVDSWRHMDMEFIYALDQLRERLKFPMIITSGYRCPAYNDVVSTTGPHGPHTTGRAADVAISGEKAFRLVQQCTLGGWMTGIGINQKGPHEKRFIHLDDLGAPDHPRPRVWTY